jgi:hypothetical protein
VIKLDIRYQPLGNREKTISDSIKQEIETQLESLYGHLAPEMKATNGYVLVYTLDGTIYGTPQIINCSDAVLGKIVLMERKGMDK